jgi:hypothetical protein
MPHNDIICNVLLFRRYKNKVINKVITNIINYCLRSPFHRYGGRECYLHTTTARHRYKALSKIQIRTGLNNSKMFVSG